MDNQMTSEIAAAVAEPITDHPTRAAPQKWVVVVDRDLAPEASASGVARPGVAVDAQGPSHLLGPSGADGGGAANSGLPWVGAPLLATHSDALRDLRTRAATCDEVLVVDMPVAAALLAPWVYDDHLSELAGTDPAAISYNALGLIGARDRVGKLGLLP